MKHAKAAAPHHQRNRHRRKKIDRRVIERVSKDRVYERDHVLPVHGFKILEGALFAIEKLHHAHARDMFLRESC